VNGYSKSWVLSKQASTSTHPIGPGKYNTPTSYIAEWANYHSSTGRVELAGLGANRGITRFKDIGAPEDLAYRFNPTNFSTPPSWVWNKLEIKALNKLRNSDVDFGVMLAEANETADLFTTNTRRIARRVELFKDKHLDLFEKAKRFSGTRHWRQVPNLWLENAYGWTPLLQDLYGACSALEKRNQTQKSYVRVAASTKYPYKDTRGANFGQGITVDLSVEVLMECKVLLFYQLNSYLLAKLSSLGLANPASIVWEKLRYSFVIDWLVPVGNWISALGGDFGYNFVSGSRSSFGSGSIQSSNAYVGSALKPFWVPSTNSSISGKVGSFRRSVYVSSPVPLLYLKSPVSPTHIANALSLLTSAFYKPSRRIER